MITSVTNVLGPSHPVISFTEVAKAVYVPTAVLLGAETILPPVAASYHTIVSPALGVALTVWTAPS